MERMCVVVVGHGFALAMCRDVTVRARIRRSAARFEQQRVGRVRSEEFQVQGGSRPYGCARMLDFVYILHPQACGARLAIFLSFKRC
jgi:hypothetical protein